MKVFQHVSQTMHIYSYVCLSGQTKYLSVNVSVMSLFMTTAHKQILYLIVMIINTYLNVNVDWGECSISRHWNERGKNRNCISIGTCVPDYLSTFSPGFCSKTLFLLNSFCSLSTSPSLSSSFSFYTVRRHKVIVILINTRIAPYQFLKLL